MINYNKNVKATISNTYATLRVAKGMAGNVIQKQNDIGDWRTIDQGEATRLAQRSSDLREFLDAHVPNFWKAAWIESPMEKRLRIEREERAKNQGWAKPAVPDEIIKEFPIHEFNLASGEGLAVRSVIVKDPSTTGGTRRKAQIMFKNDQYKTKELSPAVLADLKRLGAEPSKEKVFSGMTWTESLTKEQVYEIVKDFGDDSQLISFIENNI